MFISTFKQPPDINVPFVGEGDSCLEQRDRTTLTMLMKNILPMLLFLCCDLVTGYGGWGPGEGYGHAGRDPPRKNWNAKYGYDNTNTLHNRYNYR